MLVPHLMGQIHNSLLFSRKAIYSNVEVRPPLQTDCDTRERGKGLHCRKGRVFVVVVVVVVVQRTGDSWRQERDNGIPKLFVLERGNM